MLTIEQQQAVDEAIKGALLRTRDTLFDQIRYSYGDERRRALDALDALEVMERMVYAARDNRDY